jgi:dTDP-4-amino-4,6-dideoxygalactose transaminase
VDKYTWVDLGSSYLPGEIVAAFLWAQMEEADSITARRHEVWSTYHAAFAGLEATGAARRPIVPAECAHNAHMYYLLLRDLSSRTAFIDQLERRGIRPVFHYIPLHSSPYGRTVSRTQGSLETTDDHTDRLVRLPFWIGMGELLDEVTSATLEALSGEG